MDNADWSDLLDANFYARIDHPYRPRFPAPAYIRLGGDRNRATMHLSAAAVMAGAMTDNGAFDSWALVLMAWCDATHVHLSWDKPPESRNPGNYQRFLYRAEELRNLLGDGFSYDELDSFTGHGLVLGLPPARMQPDFVANARSEKELEALFIHPLSPARKALFEELDLSAIDAQFPVGVLRGETPASQRSFGGSNNAIDLIARGGNGELWLFELKSDDTRAIGALSELLFYAHVLGDIAAGKVQVLANETAGTQITAEDLLGASRLHARIAAGTVHPLIDRQIFDLMNYRAQQQDWTADFGALNVERFRAKVANG